MNPRPEDPRAALIEKMAEAFWDAVDRAVCVGDTRPHDPNPIWGDRADPPEDFDRWYEFMASRMLTAALASPDALLSLLGAEQVGCVDEDGHLADLDDVRGDTEYLKRWHADGWECVNAPQWEPVYRFVPVSSEPKERGGADAQQLSTIDDGGLSGRTAGKGSELGDRDTPVSSEEPDETRYPGWQRDQAILGGDPSL